jgi:hypothetical protein
MKVGIITHHWPANFGANLQAFSTVHTLQSMGHDVVVLNYRPLQMSERYQRITAPEQLAEHEGFIAQYLPESRLCRTECEVVEVAMSEGVEVVISGSDAVLRLTPGSTREDLSFPNPFWLQWAERGVRTGFLAASCMGSQYFQLPKETRRQIKSSVISLDVCSVRDRWTEWMLRSCGVPKLKIRHCPDPVSGLRQAVAGMALEHPNKDARPYLLVSLYDGMLPNEWLVEFVQLAHERGYRVYSFPQPDVLVDGPYDKVLNLPMSPIDWYQWIVGASGYVGVRFHPIMLSQINFVPYVALDEYDVGLKFSGRYAAGAARRLQFMTRFVSKTYDASRRVERRQCCIPPRDYKQTKPVDVLDLLDCYRNDRSNQSMIEQNEKRFRATLQEIIGDAV